MTNKEIKNTLTEYGINIFLAISTMLVFILLGYIASGLIQNIFIKDLVQAIFPIFGLFLQYLELKYEYISNNIIKK